MLSHIHSFYPQYTRSTRPVMTIQNIFRWCQMSLRGAKLLLVENHCSKKCFDFKLESIPALFYSFISVFIKSH